MSKSKAPIHPDLRAALAMLGDIPADAVTAAECWKAVAPKCPSGITYLRGSFWGVIQIPVLVRTTCTRIALVVAHINDRKHRYETASKPWPPKALFVKVATLPQPLNGKK